MQWGDSFLSALILFLKLCCNFCHYNVNKYIQNVFGVPNPNILRYAASDKERKSLLIVVSTCDDLLIINLTEFRVT